MLGPARCRAPRRRTRRRDRWLPVVLCAALLAGCAEGGGAGSSPTPTSPSVAPSVPAVRPLTVTSPAYADGARIPVEYTCDGDNTSIPFATGPVPRGTVELAFTLVDPRSPDPDGGAFVFWAGWGLPPGVPQDAGVAATHETLNGFGKAEYVGPCPGRGDGLHDYVLTVWALSRHLDLDDGAGAADLTAAVRGHVLARGTLTGTFARR